MKLGALTAAMIDKVLPLTGTEIQGMLQSARRRVDSANPIYGRSMGAVLEEVEAMLADDFQHLHDLKTVGGTDNE